MTPLARIASGIVFVAAAAVGGAGTAAAGEATLRYRCSMPLFPEQSLTVRLTWHAPESVLVGQKTPIVPFDAVATMGEVVTQGLAAVGAASVEGTATAVGVVAAPGGSRTVSVPLTVPRTPVPPGGPITVVASGSTPELVFDQPGRATLSAGGEFAVRLVPRTTGGGSTFIGAVDASCTLEPGQNTVITPFDIVAPQADPAPAPDAPAPPITTTAVGGGPGVPATPGTPETPGTTGSGDSSAAANSASAPSSGIRGTGGTRALDTRDTAFPTASTDGLADATAPLLVAGGILVLGIVIGCVYWLRTRYRRGGPDHSGPV